jgi:hypothetical protein
METDITLWFFSCLDCSESRLVFLNVILEGTYHPLNMTWANDHTRHYRANRRGHHHEVHDEFLFGTHLLEGVVEN